MDSAIKKLYYGDFGRCDQLNRMSERYYEYLEKTIDYEKKLSDFFKFFPEQAGWFEELKNALEEIAGQQIVEYYRYGFRNGFLLALDVLADE